MYDHILSRIRKILTKAENPAATPEEAEAHTAKAAELIAKYGIDHALLAQQDPTSDLVGQRLIVVDPPYAAHKAYLLQRLAGQLCCEAVQCRGSVTGAKQLCVHLFGFESDLTRTELLYTSRLTVRASCVS